MKSFRLRALGLGAAIAVVAVTASFAQDDKAALLKMRQDFMERQQNDFNAISAFAKGQGDQADAVAKTQDLISLAPQIAAQFSISGTSTTDFPGKSRAKPEIFQSADKVKAYVAILQADEQKLLTVVQGGDRAAISD